MTTELLLRIITAVWMLALVIFVPQSRKFIAVCVGVIIVALAIIAILALAIGP